MITAERISLKMKAVVLERPGRLALKEIPIWPLETYGDEDLVLIRVAACGICGSDYRYFSGENPWAQQTLGKFVENPQNIVLGHEISGEVVAVLDSKNASLLGKRVAVFAYKPCGLCHDCLSGHGHLCMNTIHLGHGQGWGRKDYYPGGYAEYVPAWGKGCVEIPGELSFGEGAILDILSVAVHVALLGKIELGGAVLVIGAGPAGNGIAQASKSLGASIVVVVDQTDVSINLAKKQNLGFTIDVRGKSKENLLEELRKVAPNGYCSVFDTVGTSESCIAGMAALGRSGHFVEVAAHDQIVAINLMAIGGERNVVSSCNASMNDFVSALDLLGVGRLQVKDWLTTIRLPECPEAITEAVKSRSERTTFKLIIGL